MSRGKKKVSAEEMIAHADEIETPQTEFYAVEGKEVTAEEFAEKINEEVNEPAIQTSTDVEDRTKTLEWASRYIQEHSRRRGGSVSGMMPTAYRITISGGRVRYFTLPMNIEECAVEESWKRCKRYMTPEEFMAFLTRVLGIPPPPFYGSFRVISIE